MSSQSDRLKEITDKLEAGVRGIFESDSYKGYLKTMSKFHDYSYRNTLLIYLQRPSATLVAGYSAWRDKFGRSVMKGEKGIRILAPSPYKVKNEKERTDPESGKPLIGADRKPVKDTETTEVMSFRVVTVFDVSQTDGKPLPEIKAMELTGGVERYGNFFAALKEVSPVPIHFERLQEGAKGYYHQTEKRIAIKCGMSELQTLKTAVHEIAHARLHDIDKDATNDVPRPDYATGEVEAESVAYTVCEHYGLDTSDYSFGYIAGWSGGKEIDTLKASLNTIRTEADAIITGIDAHLDEAAQLYEEALLGEEMEDFEELEIEM
jgi:antirestriction protein ArdC